MLKLGYNLIYDWHTYLLYEKWKYDKFFKQHIIRKVLHLIWQKYGNVYVGEKPLWMIPLKVVKQRTDYGDLLKLKIWGPDILVWR